MQNQSESLAEVDNLSAEERSAFDRWLSQDKPPISVGTSARMYEAYLNGASCKEIAKLHPGFEFGAIVHARLRDKWDAQLNDHRAALFEAIWQRVMQIQMEAIGFTADQLAAAHKRDGDKIKKFLMSGDERELGDASYVTGIRSYKDMIAVLLALTGQDKKQGPSTPMAVQVNVDGKAAEGTSVKAIFTEKPPTEDQAERLLKALENMGDG